MKVPAVCILFLGMLTITCAAQEVFGEPPCLREDELQNLISKMETILNDARSIKESITSQYDADNARMAECSDGTRQSDCGDIFNDRFLIVQQDRFDQIERLKSVISSFETDRDRTIGAQHRWRTQNSEFNCNE